MQSERIVTALKFSLDWCEMYQIEPPLELQVRAAMAVKSLPFFSKVVKRLVQSVYDGLIGGEFVTTLKNLISGQMRKAYEEAWKIDGTGGPMPDYLTKAAADLASEQAQYVDGFYQAIVDARVDKTSIEPLQVRADLWANRYNQAKNDAESLIAQENGGKLIWREGDTIEKCPTCLALDGIVAFATEWAQAGFKPQNAPNKQLDCEGWHCGCSLTTTTQRRSPKALETLMNIAVARTMA